MVTGTVANGAGLSKMLEYFYTVVPFQLQRAHCMRCKTVGEQCVRPVLEIVAAKSRFWAKYRIIKSLSST